jgi:molecular chaperone GrpE
MIRESSTEKTEKTTQQQNVQDRPAGDAETHSEGSSVDEVVTAEEAVDMPEKTSASGSETATAADRLSEAFTDDMASEETPATNEAVEPVAEVDETSKMREALAEVNDKYIRLLAEFENFKRRSTQELQTRFRYANQGLALSIISGLDNLERAIAQANEEENESLKEFVTGVEMVLQQFYDAFAKNDIERIFPIRESFDPNRHEAVSVVETDAVAPDHIAEVFQAGYILHDRVIRPAMVQVAKKQ